MGNGWTIAFRKTRAHAPAIGSATTSAMKPELLFIQIERLAKEKEKEVSLFFS